MPPYSCGMIMPKRPSSFSPSMHLGRDGVLAIDLRGVDVRRPRICERCRGSSRCCRDRRSAELGEREDQVLGDHAVEEGLHEALLVHADFLEWASGSFLVWRGGGRIRRLSGGCWESEGTSAEGVAADRRRVADDGAERLGSERKATARFSGALIDGEARRARQSTKPDRAAAS